MVINGRKDATAAFQRNVLRLSCLTIRQIMTETGIRIPFCLTKIAQEDDREPRRR
jgi:hypothetical protein